MAKDLSGVTRIMQEVEGAERRQGRLEGQIEAEVGHLGMPPEQAEAEIAALQSQLKDKGQELEAAYAKLIGQYYADTPEPVEV
jgi:hypothetical protein